MDAPERVVFTVSLELISLPDRSLAVRHSGHLLPERYPDVEKGVVAFRRIRRALSDISVVPAIAT